ncbi:hypothetical protein J4210_05980 [Candidatus Woesearchaeota archaeon]|nr:hypothetical protein [Candidatus Woesearchaeota archaeon]
MGNDERTDIRKTRTCERCKNVVPLDQVRLYPKDETRNLLLCEPCCSEVKEQNAGNLMTSKIKPLAPSELINYLCTRCSYRFKADRAKAGVTYNLNCPYCGKNDKLEKMR